MILALDYGERYVGVAVTDPDGRIALRHSVIDQKTPPPSPPLSGRGALFDAVLCIIEEERVEKVLVGVPLNLEGNETEQTHVSLGFIEKLREVLGNDVAIEGVDETLTSKEAERTIRAEGGKLEDEHAEAARIMLEDYLLSQGK